jgi:hypothetical protein
MQPAKRNKQVQLHPLQHDGVCAVRIPLADIEVLVAIDTYVVAMFENIFFLDHQLKVPVAVFRLGATWIGDYAVIAVEDRHES